MGDTGVVATIIQVIVAAGGIAGLVSLLTIRATKKKILAESGKTDAEAHNLLEDAAMKRTEREVRLIEPYERMHVRLQSEIDGQAEKIEHLEDYIEVLVELLRAQGITVPPRRSRKDTDGKKL